MSTVGPDGPANSLSRAYRYCLRAYPAWYRLAFGDDLMAVLEESHAGERRPSARECASLVLAGLRRRVAAARADKAGAAYASAVTLECLGALTLVATGISLATELWSSPPYPVLQLRNIAFRIGTYQHHLFDLAAYLLLVVLLAAVFGLAAVRAWERVGIPALDADFANGPEQAGSVFMERWSALDAGALIAQPVIAFMGALALSVRVDAVNPVIDALSKDQAWVSTALLVVGLATGCALTGLMWRRMRLGAAAMRRTAVVALSLAAVAWIAFVTAGGQFGGSGSAVAWAPVISYGPTAPGGSDLGTGFTTVRLAATGQTDPLSVTCTDSAHCLAFGLPLEVSGAAAYGAIYSTSSGQWKVAPFRTSTAHFSTESLGQNLLTCPGSRTCYALSLNAPRLAALARSTDAGLRWQRIVLPFKQTRPSGSYGFPGLQAACMSANACVFAVPQGFAVTLDGGSSWVNRTLFSSLPAPGGVPAHGVLNDYLAGVACPGARVCFVTVETLERSRGYESSTTWLFSTHDAGRTWTRAPIGPLTVRATGLSLPTFLPGNFACADVLHCVLVTPAASHGPARVLLTADGGATFAAWTAPAAWGQDQVGVTCVAGLDCWALPTSGGQREIWRSVDGGRHWTEVSPLPDGISFGGTPFRFGGGAPGNGIIACPSADRCIAVGYRPDLGALQPNVFVSTTDGGRTWDVESIPALPPKYRPLPPIVD